MRDAATRDESIHDEISDDPYPAPTVSGFTPVNPPGSSDTAPIPPEHKDAIKPKSADKPRAPKRRRTGPSTAATTPKPKKAAKPNKTKKAKTVAQSHCQDISQGLSRTKPTPSRDGAISSKAGLPLEEMPLGQNSELRGIGDTSVPFEVKPAVNGRKKQSMSSRLSDKNQPEYASVRNNVYDQATPPTPPKSDEVEAELNYNDQSHGQDSDIERQASPIIFAEPCIQRTLESHGRIIVRDFGAPPFTQTSPPTPQAWNSPGTMIADGLDPLDSISDDLFRVDNINRGVPGEEDEFPMDDEGLEEMMKSIAAPVEEERLGSDWQPQDPSSDTLYVDEQLESDQSHWLEPIPDSHGVAIYNEDRTLVASDIFDVPSSPQGSSQASRILTHVTGNANPDRPRMSEGSEDCFDDHDLDELDDDLIDLIDLTVDESKPVQVTSPVTPTKRPLSPKLKWLSPKTYTPAKSSRLPVSPTDDTHLVPVNSHGDALPFMRPPFPKAVRDRSPILGLTNRNVLRICFRIGEALNAAAVASRTNVDAIIELYARVVSSSREASGGYKQFFEFADLFTDRPPYLCSTYTFWKGVNLWDNDTKELVGEQGRGKMVRVLGRIKRKEPRQGQAPGVEMVVLSIWEVDWEDVGIAKGIACPKER